MCVLFLSCRYKVLTFKVLDKLKYYQRYNENH